MSNEQWLIYVVQTILIATSILVTLYKSGILKAQLKAQEKTLKNYTDFMEAIDISKFKEYTQMIEEMGQLKIEAERLKLDKKLTEESKKYEEHYSSYFTEVALYIVWSINGVKKDRAEKLKMLKDVFPLSYPLICDRIV